MKAAPASKEEAIARLRDTDIPAPIVEVARELQAAGHAAVLVGGAVRDALLDRKHGDWDLASSATPEEVQSIFRRTIPTGIEHGTITVMVGPKDAREAVEVTTFRGEGVYLDGRRPSEVRFLRELDDDLARRDFTINALAWDPIAQTFFDSFGGLEDLQARRVRAVGVPLQRFEEDGLRTMRAVRFAAVLEFELDAETEAAIGSALEVFDKVSRERVHVELFKLLGARRPSLGLLPMLRTGLWGRVLGEATVPDAESSVRAVDKLEADAELRLARLLWPIRGERAEVEGVVDALKPSRATRKRVLALCHPQVEALGHATGDGIELRRAAAALGREHLGAAQDLLDWSPDKRAALDTAIEGAPLSAKELAVTAKDLISESVLSAGPQMGDLLRELLQRCLENPTLNEREALLCEARGWVTKQEDAGG